MLKSDNNELPKMGNGSIWVHMEFKKLNKTRLYKVRRYGRKRGKKKLGPNKQLQRCKINKTSCKTGQIIRAKLKS